MKMKLFFKEDGSISEEGLKVLGPVKNYLISLFDTNLISQMSSNQIRLLGSWICKTVDDVVLEK